METRKLAASYIVLSNVPSFCWVSDLVVIFWRLGKDIGFVISTFRLFGSFEWTDWNLIIMELCLVSWPKEKNDAGNEHSKLWGREGAQSLIPVLIIIIPAWMFMILQYYCFYLMDSTYYTFSFFKLQISHLCYVSCQSTWKPKRKHQKTGRDRTKSPDKSPKAQIKPIPRPRLHWLSIKYLPLLQ